MNDDLILQPRKKTPRFIADCGCKEEWHKTHTGRACGVRVERDAVPALGYYVCYDCKKENQSAYEMKYQKEHREEKKKRDADFVKRKSDGIREFNEWVKKQRHAS